MTATTVEAVTEIPVTFSDGGFFADEFAGQAMTLTFTSTTTFTATAGGTTISGTVSYGSCTFTPPGAPRGFHNPCSINLDLTRRRPEASITLGRSQSQVVTVPVTVRNIGNGTCELRRGAMIITTTQCTVSGSG